jgi:hypothetical protein
MLPGVQDTLSGFSTVILVMIQEIFIILCPDTRPVRNTIPQKVLLF